MGLELKKIKKEIETEIEKFKQEVNVEEEKKFATLLQTRVNAVLKKIVCNTKDNKLMRNNEAYNYYFSNENGYEHLCEKYNLIIDLQFFLTEKINTQFVYDKFTLLKILQLPLQTYNNFVETCIQNQKSASTSEYQEDIANVFLEIESLLITDRLNAAEQGNLDSKAVDNTNRYSKNIGGYGLTPIKPKDDLSNADNRLNSTDEILREIKQKFNFSDRLKESDETAKTSAKRRKKKE